MFQGCSRMIGNGKNLKLKEERRNYFLLYTINNSIILNIFDKKILMNQNFNIILVPILETKKTLFCNSEISCVELIRSFLFTFQGQAFMEISYFVCKIFTVLEELIQLLQYSLICIS